MTCRYCDGTGQVVCKTCHGSGWVGGRNGGEICCGGVDICPYCGGTGRDDNDDCEEE